MIPLLILLQTVTTTVLREVALRRRLRFFYLTAGRDFGVRAARDVRALHGSAAAGYIPLSLRPAARVPPMLASVAKFPFAALPRHRAIISASRSTLSKPPRSPTSA